MTDHFDVAGFVVAHAPAALHAAAPRSFDLPDDADDADTECRNDAGKRQ